MEQTIKTEYTDASLKALYDAADEFKKLALWDIFCEIDIMEIQFEGEEETYYCSIKGMFEDTAGISIYKGQKGLVSLSGYINATELPEYVSKARKNCIECIWTSRTELKKQDREDIKAAGKKYRGNGNWPMFRIYETGFEEWSLSAEERYTALAVISSVNAAVKEMKEDGSFSDINEGERICRIYDSEKGCMVNEIMPAIEKIEAFTDGCMITDELLLRRLKKRPLNGKILEFDIPYIPVPVLSRDGKTRGFYPQMSIMCDVRNGKVEDQYYIDKRSDIRDIILGSMIAYIELHGRPNALFVRDMLLYAIIGDLCEGTDIKITITPQLPVMDEYVADFTRRLIEEAPVGDDDYC